MWKKRLILIVTFLAGLYYFLEFVVPPIMPGTNMSGIVQSIDAKTDNATKTTNAKVTLTSFKHIQRLKVKEGVNVTWIDGADKRQIAISKVKPTYILQLANGDQAVALTTSLSRVKVGVLGDSKVVNAKIVDGKSKTMAFKVEPGGGETEIDDVSTLAEGDVVSQLGQTTYISKYITDANNTLNVLATMPWGFALFSLWFMHSSAIRKRTKDWPMSVLFFAGLAFGILAGLGSGLDAKVPFHLGFWTIDSQILINLNDLVAQRVQFAFYSATMSILSFYLASAAYRSFKAKSKEAILMMVSALVVMLGQIPFGVYLTSWIPGQAGLVPAASRWLQMILNMGSLRGMLFGIVLASMAIGLRYWLSLERGAFFDREL